MNDSSYARTSIVDRAQGCLMGQLCGDALGSLVEYSTEKELKVSHPHGVREMADGGYFCTIAGQPTDDSEMALALARSLLNEGKFDADAVRAAYRNWLDTKPFDCGITIYQALKKGYQPAGSESNGALMRISPLGIFGSRFELSEVAEWARLDAAITHGSRVCYEISSLFSMAIAQAVREQTTPEALYSMIVTWAKDIEVSASVESTILSSQHQQPARFDGEDKGWVLIAFGNTLWQLLYAPNFEEGLVDTIRRGGDTDTNAAICGALLGAVYGISGIPPRWTATVLNCRPNFGLEHIKRPRPEQFWPVDALDLAERLVGGNRERLSRG